MHVGGILESEGWVGFEGDEDVVGVDVGLAGLVEILEVINSGAVIVGIIVCVVGWDGSGSGCGSGRGSRRVRLAH